MAERSRLQGYPSNRVEGYTDAVFAIAATLLVLSLTTPALGTVNSNADLMAALGRIWPVFGAFLLSFALLSVLWMVHLEQFRDIARADSVLVWLNNIRLLFVIVMPFATTLTSDYGQYYAGRIALPATFFFAALFGHLCWEWAAARDGHLLSSMNPEEVSYQRIGGASAVICGAVAAILSPWIGSFGFLAFFLNEPIAYLLTRRARSRWKSAHTP